MLDLSSCDRRDDGARKDIANLLKTMERGGAVYILTNVNRTVLYVGVTSDLIFRLAEHREKIHPKSFTAKYNAIICVYYEVSRT